jgi:hypothetical protein
MNRCLKAIDYHRKNNLIADSERSYKKRQELAKFGWLAGMDRDRVSIAGRCNLKSGISREQTADSFEIGTHPRRVEFLQQCSDLDSRSHGSFCRIGRGANQDSRLGRQPRSININRTERADVAPRFQPEQPRRTVVTAGNHTKNSSREVRHVFLISRVINLLMVEIDWKLAGVISEMGIIRSNSDSTSSTSLTVSRDVRPTSIRLSSAQIGRVIERSSNTCWMTATTRCPGERS